MTLKSFPMIIESLLQIELNLNNYQNQNNLPKNFFNDRLDMWVIRFIHLKCSMCSLHKPDMLVIRNHSYHEKLVSYEKNHISFLMCFITLFALVFIN